MPYRPPYSPEFRAQAVRLYAESGKDVHEVAETIGVSHQTLRNWIKQSGIDSGAQPGLTTDERKQLRDAQKRIAKLEQENAFLKKAAAWFAAETDRSSSRKRSG